MKHYIVVIILPCCLLSLYYLSSFQQITIYNAIFCERRVSAVVQGEKYEVIALDFSHCSDHFSAYLVQNIHRQSGVAFFDVARSYEERDDAPTFSWVNPKRVSVKINDIAHINTSLHFLDGITINYSLAQELITGFDERMQRLQEAELRSSSYVDHGGYSIRGYYDQKRQQHADIIRWFKDNSN